MIRPRPLTYDEGKAAEAAFRGLPLNPNWTEGARSVYLGIISALRLRTATDTIAVVELENPLDLQPASV
jgi:hypothetical protein